MKICNDMNLDSLIELMGESICVEGSRYATHSEAHKLRNLLILKFLDKDTSDIEVGLWNIYCEAARELSTSK